MLQTANNTPDIICMQFTNSEGFPVRFLDDKYWIVLEKIVFLCSQETE